MRTRWRMIAGSVIAVLLAGLVLVRVFGPWSDGSIAGRAGELAAQATPSGAGSPVPTRLPASPSPKPTPPALLPQPPAGFPTPDSTGWRHTGVKLKTQNERVYAETPGKVYDGMDFRDGILVRADNVTIKRSRVQCGDCPAIWVDWDVKNTVIEDVEITSQSDTDRIDRAITAGRTDNLTVRRVHVHNTQRGIEFGRSALIEDSWVDETNNPTAVHSSAVSGETTQNFSLTVRHNWIAQRPGQNNSGAMVYYPGDTGTAQQSVKILIERNIFNGGTYALWLSSDPRMVGTLAVQDNLFGTKYFDSCGAFNTHYTDKLNQEGAVKVAWQNNTWYAPGKTKNGKQVPFVIPQ